MIRNKLTSLLMIWIFAVASVAFTHEAHAQSSNSKKPEKTRKAVLSFEDELVEGSTQKPELFYLFQKKNFNYKRLIKLRENFLPEMRQTAEDIQRVRGVR